MTDLGWGSNPGQTSGVTRRELLGGAALGAAALRLGLDPTSASGATKPSRTYVVATPAELEQVRRNVFDLRLGFAVRAWENTLGRARSALGHRASPADPRGDYAQTWFEGIYRPGLTDGNHAYNAALAFALTREPDYARKAREICLDWARRYRPLPGQERIGHFVAEPVGPAIKLFMAFDLARATFSPSEAREFTGWAELFVQRGISNSDSARDRPWAADVTYGSETTNAAAFSNSATWQRAMAVIAAAAVGPARLREVLEWNLDHTTAGGNRHGWDELLEGVVLSGTGGQVLEDRLRRSLHYGHFQWMPLVYIADVARRAGHRVDLFTYRTRRNGHSVFEPLAYHGPFLLEETVPSSLELEQYGGPTWPVTAARWRATYEVLYRNATRADDVARLRGIVNHGGPSRRGDNYDIYVTNFAALLGRGPKGPMPAVPGKSRKVKR